MADGYETMSQEDEAFLLAQMSGDLVIRWIKMDGDTRPADATLSNIRQAITEEFDARNDEEADALRNARELRLGRKLPGKQPGQKVAARREK